MIWIGSSCEEKDHVAWPKLCHMQAISYRRIFALSFAERDGLSHYRARDDRRASWRHVCHLAQFPLKQGLDKKRKKKILLVLRTGMKLDAASLVSQQSSHVNEHHKMH